MCQNVAPARRAVEQRRLVVRDRDRLNPRDEQHHVEAHRLPDHHGRDRPQRRRRIAEPGALQAGLAGGAQNLLMSPRLG